MNLAKRIITILAVLVCAMLIIPIITVNTVKADAGMLVTLLLFFVLNPAVSILTGIMSGGDVRHLWYTPLLTAILFWGFSSFTYQTAFPIVYSLIYFVLCGISMLISSAVAKRRR